MIKPPWHRIVTVNDINFETVSAAALQISWKRQSRDKNTITY